MTRWRACLLIGALLGAMLTPLEATADQAGPWMYGDEEGDWVEPATGVPATVTPPPDYLDIVGASDGRQRDGSHIFEVHFKGERKGIIQDDRVLQSFRLEIRTSDGSGFTFNGNYSGGVLDRQDYKVAPDGNGAPISADVRWPNTLDGEGPLRIHVREKLDPDSSWGVTALFRGRQGMVVDEGPGWTQLLPGLKLASRPMPDPETLAGRAAAEPEVPRDAAFETAHPASSGEWISRLALPVGVGVALAALVGLGLALFRRRSSRPTP